MQFKSFFALGEFYIRITIVTIVFIIMSIVGGLAIYGGGIMETDNPNLFDSLGGWWIIRLAVQVYLGLTVLLPIWIMIIGREKQIILWIKRRFKKDGPN